MRKNQKGIALIETLLIILTLAIIGFGGYYVWHTQKSTDKVNSDTVKASQSTPVVSKDASSAQKYLTIKEWGVKGPNSTVVHLQYKIDNSNGHPNANFTSTELLAAGGSDCSDGGGDILVYSGSDTADFLGNGETTEQAAANGDITYYSLVSDKYYIFRSPQAACGDPDKVQTAQTDTLNAVRALSQGLQAE